MNIKISNIQYPISLYLFVSLSFIFLSLVLCSLLFAGFASADTGPKSESLNMLKGAGEAAGYAAGTTGEYTLAATIGMIINGVLGLLGVLFLVLTVYAGYLWLTAGGDEEQVKKARAYLYNGLIGLLIILASYGLARFVVNTIINAAT